MKKVCPKCGNNHLYKHGKKRRKCVKCGATCSIQSGRHKTHISDMYVLDRSTFRRIGYKSSLTHQNIMYHVYNELKHIPQLLSYTKKFSLL